MFTDAIIRLLVAGVCGILIGWEREFHAKEAGVRTHFLVCFGSALFMIVSVFGFADSAGLPGVRGADQARIAAQIVSGIGFIGAGTIMFNRQTITGLTTAAGLWVAAGVGMAIGSGMYLIGVFCTIIVILGLEVLQFFFRRIRLRASSLVYSTTDLALVTKVDEAIEKSGWRVQSHDIKTKTKNKKDGKVYQVTLTLQRHDNVHKLDLMELLQQFPEINPERVE